jgi:hypothetical protein
MLTTVCTKLKGKISHRRCSIAIIYKHVHKDTISKLFDEIVHLPHLAQDSSGTQAQSQNICPVTGPLAKRIRSCSASIKVI